MKIIYNILLITLLFASSSYQANLKSESFSNSMASTFPSNYFDGEWDGAGYTCQAFNKTPVTKIMMSTEGDKVIAMKVTGDACVNAGHQTVEFTAKDLYNAPGNFGCRITLGNAWNPQSSSSTNCKVQIVDCNTFKVNNWKLTYTRVNQLDCATAFQEPEVPEPTPEPVPVVPQAPVVPVVSIPVITFGYDFFKGNWEGDSYNCNGTLAIQTINIQYNDGYLLAYKTTGDTCVKSGSLSFSAMNQDNYPKCAMCGSFHIPCRFVSGTPTLPSSVISNNCTIEIIDKDTFGILQEGITYTRIPCGEELKEEKPVIGA